MLMTIPIYMYTFILLTLCVFSDKEQFVIKKAFENIVGLYEHTNLSFNSLEYISYAGV